MYTQHVAKLILRVVLGLIFFTHGLAKVEGGLDKLAGWFNSIGLPGLLAYPVAYIELIGGISLVMGFAVRLIAFAFAAIMVGAIITVKWRHGLLGTANRTGFEFDLALLAISLYLSITGDRGPFQIGTFFSKKNHPSGT